MYKGRLFRLQNGLVVCPVKPRPTGWFSIVVRGTRAFPYQGKELLIRDDDLAAAERVDI